MAVSGRDILHHLRRFLMFVGVVVWIVAIYTAARELETARWPSVPGEVTSTDIKRHVHSHEGGGTRYSYAPVVAYRYRVRGVQYESDRLSACEVAGRESYARRRRAEYGPGAKVTVYYDPEDPASAVLERGLSWVTFLVFALGIMLLAAVVGIHLYLRWTEAQGDGTPSRRRREGASRRAGKGHLERECR